MVYQHLKKYLAIGTRIELKHEDCMGALQNEGLEVCYLCVPQPFTTQQALVLTLSQTSPSFYGSAVQVF